MVHIHSCVLILFSQFSNQHYPGLDLPSAPSPSIFFSFHHFSGEFEWDGIKRALVFCRGCSVWVATITQGGGKTTKRWEERREEKWEREMCAWSLHSESIVYSGVWLFHFLSSLVYSLTQNKAERFSADRRRRSSTLSSQWWLRMNGDRWRTPVDNSWVWSTVASLPPPTLTHTDAGPLERQTHHFRVGMFPEPKLQYQVNVSILKRDSMLFFYSNAGTAEGSAQQGSRLTTFGQKWLLGDAVNSLLTSPCPSVIEIKICSVEQPQCWLVSYFPLHFSLKNVQPCALHGICINTNFS